MNNLYTLIDLWSGKPVEPIDDNGTAGSPRFEHGMIFSSEAVALRAAEYQARTYGTDSVPLPLTEVQRHYSGGRWPRVLRVAKKRAGELGLPYPQPVNSAA